LNDGAGQEVGLIWFTETIFVTTHDVTSREAEPRDVRSQAEPGTEA
jgi:hypothetical protein